MAKKKAKKKTSKKLAKKATKRKAKPSGKKKSVKKVKKPSEETPAISSNLVVGSETEPENEFDQLSDGTTPKDDLDLEATHDPSHWEQDLDDYEDEIEDDY